MKLSQIKKYIFPRTIPFLSYGMEALSCFVNNTGQKNITYFCPFYVFLFEMPAALVFGFTPISLPVSLLHHTWNNHLHLFSSQFLFILLLTVCSLFFAHGRGIPVKAGTWGVQLCLSSLCFLSLVGSCDWCLLKFRHLSTCTVTSMWCCSISH